MCDSFYCVLLCSASQSASDNLSKALAGVSLNKPRIPVYSNVTAGPFPEDEAEIKKLLMRQLTEPVQVTCAPSLSLGCP